MEHPELVEETVPTLPTSNSLPAEDTTAHDAPLSVPTRGKSLHGHSDSMVTVRLSTMDKTDPADCESTPGTPVASTHNGVTGRPESHFDEEDNTTRPSSISEMSISQSESNRTSTSMTDDDEEFIPLERTKPMREQSVSPRSSATASNETPTPEGEEITPKPRGTEVNRVGRRERSISFASSKSTSSSNVDWEKLDKNEEEEERHQGTDESTAFLLARLEQENNALATDPKSGLASHRERKGSRPPSIQQLQKMVTEPTSSNLRYSTLPSPPPMTELEFWSALVRDYPATAQRLPTLTANKIRQGIPPPLRGVVWQSIAGARDSALEEEYEKLCLESSPYEKMIHKDIGRSFPGVDMFRDPEGEGQRMLGKVLNAFSLYDQDIGYCQGLGFVVGPLLMHMGDKEAFCTLVRLMDQYGLRSCFLPTLTGLHLRIYQYQNFLSQYLPNISSHLEKLNVEPLYITQWFLSFFGVTCPIPMLIRLYDVILTEGASETLMRVALSLMRKNEKKILAATEFEDVMQLLLSRSLWDPYNYNADALMADFCHWTGLVTRESLQELEAAFKESLSPSTAPKSNVHTAAQRFLGRLWNSSGGLISPRSPFASSPLAPPPATGSTLRRTPSKQSMASTLNSVEGSEFSQATSSTEATTVSREQSADWAPPKATVIANPPPGNHKTSSKDKDFHTQIEDLLTALNNMQRENSLLTEQLQREREERDEDRQVVSRIIERFKKHTALAAIPEDESEPKDEGDQPKAASLDATVVELEEHFTPASKRTSLMMQTKHQLREESTRWKAQYQEEAARSAELSRLLSERDQELVNSKESLKEARSRIQGAHKEKQRLEKSNLDLRTRKPTIDTTKSGAASPDMLSPSPSGLRELKLTRASTSAPTLQPQFTKRMSSLSTNSVLLDEEPARADDALLVELANAKTAEAMARQELEEVKTKLESFRKLLSGGSSTVSQPIPSPTTKLNAPAGHSHSFSTTKIPELEKEKLAANVTSTPISAVGGFFSGWGKRAVSNS